MEEQMMAVRHALQDAEKLKENPHAVSSAPAQYIINLLTLETSRLVMMIAERVK